MRCTRVAGTTLRAMQNHLRGFDGVEVNEKPPDELTI